MGGGSSVDMTSTRIPPEVYRSTPEHWSLVVAQKVLELFPDEEVYTGAAGISPSGVVHFGNFRDVMTTLQVLQALQKSGKSTRFIFSWDDYDRFRKVPNGVSASFQQYIGVPLSMVPDPFGSLPSYARRFEEEFEKSMEDLGIAVEYKYQTQLYTSGVYHSQIIQALHRRLEIADILLSHMSQKGVREKRIDVVKYREEFYPVTVYSRFTGKDNTQVLEFDGKNSLTYRCSDTGSVDTVDLTRDHFVKLVWKCDWPMRWAFEHVVFEPGGKDHASPGGSFDVASEVSEAIFDRRPPAFLGYEFVGLQGLAGKMSGSSGIAVSPAQLLEIYEPEVLKWLYTRKTPEQSFSLAFDTEIYRQYDEFDRESAAAVAGELTDQRHTALTMASAVLNESGLKRLPFRQAVAFGQIMDWNVSNLITFLKNAGLEATESSIESRLPRARTWLERYNPSQVLRVLSSPNLEYMKTLSAQSIESLHRLCEQLRQGFASTNELEHFLYFLPKDPGLTQKENAVRQRAFFKDLYNLILGGDTGPRLATFLWALGFERVLPLLQVNLSELTKN
jgi:lysyl-tRNA synthetase class 1